MKIIDFLSKSFVGKRIKVKNSFNREEFLTVERIGNTSRYIETGPSTKENDWYPEGYQLEEMEILFTNGYCKKITPDFEFEFENTECNNTRLMEEALGRSDK